MWGKSSKRMAVRRQWLLMVTIGFTPFMAAAQGAGPVSVLASSTLRVTTAAGSAEMPIDTSLDWNQAQPQVVRAVVIFHGKSRDVKGYFDAALRAAQLAGAGGSTIVVAPQYLNDEDARAHQVPASTLRWRKGTWESGAASSAPLAVSAYQVIDGIVAQLANTRLFPRLKTIVLAGHSGGGQAIQRYGVVGHSEQIAPKVHFRYVVANPSSYLYFGEERPKFSGESIAFGVPTDDSCPEFNHWRYGTANVHGTYVRESAARGWTILENAFAEKDIVYLLGTADVDANGEDLDKSCAAELEGPNRFLRGRAYYAWLHARHNDHWNQHLWFAPGVAHSAGKIFTSACGVSALYDLSACLEQ